MPRLWTPGDTRTGGVKVSYAVQRCREMVNQGILEVPVNLALI